MTKKAGLATKILGGAIEMSALCKSYGSFVAVDNVALDIKRGEFVTLLGASGSGKTTTLMMIAGFVSPDSGSIQIDGRDVLGLPPEKRNLGVVFQSYALFPHLSVFDNIAFPLRLRGILESEIKRKVDDVLSLVDLGALGSRRIMQISGGQQQRVALARAIVFEPPVLLMDEPLGALDRKLRDQLQGEIKRVQRDLGVTVVYVTHDQEEALALSDRIAIMSEGRIVQLGSPDDVYERPVSPFVASFLGESNLIEGQISASEDAFTAMVLRRSPSIAIRGLAGKANGGHDVVAVVRPEVITVRDAATSNWNGLRGTVLVREFMGPTVRLMVETEAGEMLVRVPRMSPDARVGLGSTVTLSWPPEDTIIFPR